MDKKQTGIVLGIILIVVLLFWKPFAEKCQEVGKQTKSSTDTTKVMIKKNKTKEMDLKKNQKKTLKVYEDDKLVENKNVIWESEDSSVASIDETGTITANKAGKCVISCHSKGQEESGDSITVVVLPEEANIYKMGFYMQPIPPAIKKRMDGKSYKKNEDISYSDLRYLSLKHYGFDGKIKSGEMVVHKDIAQDVVEIFYKLYKRNYPIEKMKLIDEYGADDTASMEDNNTSCFNYRLVAGSTHLSKHSYGCAIDINPQINPYIDSSGTISPKNGAVYADRDSSKCDGKYKNYMIQRNDEVYKLFESYGFTWGGDWKTVKDYQHFQKVANVER